MRLKKNIILKSLISSSTVLLKLTSTMNKVKVLSTICLIYSVIYLSASSPVPGGAAIKLDQRQEGDWNVRADLENFVILIMPTKLTSSIGLLDLLRLAPSTKKNIKFNKKEKIIYDEQTTKSQQQEPEREQEQDQQTAEDISITTDKNYQQQIIEDAAAIETQHFIESKTAPYHVDITKTRNNLARLHPQIDDDGELLIAHSPSISILKNFETNQNHLSRVPKAYVISIPVNRAKLIKTKNNNSKEISDSQNWHLLGDGLENCGPGLVRDSKGICKPSS